MLVLKGMLVYVVLFLLATRSKVVSFFFFLKKGMGQQKTRYF